MRKTKIICTLGPVSDGEEVIRQLFEAGMNVGRINFSHGTYGQHKEKIDRFRKIRYELGIPGAILLDTKGPEIRIGKMKEGGAYVERGQTFILTTQDLVGDEHIAHVKYPEFTKDVEVGTKILLDDGKIVMVADKIDNNQVFCSVLTGGLLTDNKGINMPDVNISMEYLSDVDRKDLEFGVSMDVDFIAASFVRRKDDISKLRAYVDSIGGKDVKIIAKIESKEGIANFEEILDIADGIMVARGDMGVEIPYERLPGIQKHIIARCLQLGKIAITATQMLESMIFSPTPTRAEISDVANAVFDGTGAIMLSGETAAGKFPVDACSAMNKIALQAERDMTGENHIVDLEDASTMVDNEILPLINYKTKDRDWRDMDSQDVTNAVGHSACTMAFDIRAKAIMAITKTGYTATRMAKFRPLTPIVAMTPYDKTFHQMALEWGVDSMRVEYKDTLEALMTHCIEMAELNKIVEKGDKVVITCGMPLDVPGNTNIIRVEEV